MSDLTDVTRRLVAVFAADVEGYSRLMGLDEAGTARTLHEHRAAVDPIVAHYGGRIVKTTGDGVLLEFPSIVAAVDCAVVVQNLMRERNRDVPEERRMLFRIGINLGDVLIDGDDGKRHTRSDQRRPFYHRRFVRLPAFRGTAGRGLSL